ncbi:SEC-C domain-containing protein [Myxococcota bacterium]|nr:SEC-C domain-containing protein [Myxococcota bacterium]MBU1533791.1 SEC-C domain-containing protein [Myxococcota bacterium]
MLLKNLSIRNISQLQPDFLLHQKIGANDRCPCGSGRKFKICCMKKGIY